MYKISRRDIETPRCKISPVPIMSTGYVFEPIKMSVFISQNQSWCSKSNRWKLKLFPNLGQSEKNWVSLHSWLGLWGTLTLATCSIIEVTAQPRAKKADAMQTSDWKSSLFFDLIFSLHQKQITFASFHKLLQQELFKPPYNASNPLCSFQSSKMSGPALKSEDQNKWRRKPLTQLPGGGKEAYRRRLIWLY